jgi:hypothetical protein
MARHGGFAVAATMSQTVITVRIATWICGAHLGMKTVLRLMIGDVTTIPNRIIARRRNSD